MGIRVFDKLCLIIYGLPRMRQMPRRTDADWFCLRETQALCPLGRTEGVTQRGAVAFRGSSVCVLVLLHTSARPMTHSIPRPVPCIFLTHWGQIINMAMPQCVGLGSEAQTGAQCVLVGCFVLNA